MRLRRGVATSITILLLPVLEGFEGATTRAEEPPLPYYLADRGVGLPTSLFGTYIAKREFIVYPFYEYTKTSAFEYKPSELGYTGGDDYLGSTVEQEILLFLGYGFTDGLAVELEIALYATTSFDKASNDPSNTPAQLEESGLGDVDMQLRWRWAAETEHRPEMFGFLEVTPPLQSSKVLLGTQDWESSFGFGVVRGYRWGTITGRVSIAWDGADSKLDLGEYAFEYLKRTSTRWRFVATLEGETDEVSLIGEAQWFFSRNAFLKLNCGFGLTQKAPDVAPEIGVLFHF
jgi:hypothetical protein